MAPDRVVDGHDGGVGGLRVVRVRHGFPVRLVRHGLRGRLPVGVERGVDLETAFVESSAPRVLGLAERVELAVDVRDDLIGDVVHEERRLSKLQVSGVGSESERGGLGLVDPLLRHPSQLGEPVEDEVTADARLHRVRQRVVVVRRPDEARQHGGLRQLQSRRRLVEVEVRRRADPVDAVREVDVVQVEREDLVLRVALLHADREGQLLELALERLCGVTGDGVLHELLRDRRSALHHLARRRVRDQRADERASSPARRVGRTARPPPPGPTCSRSG